jgi:glucosylceramidase
MTTYKFTLPKNISYEILNENKVLIFESYKKGKDLHYFKERIVNFEKVSNNGWQWIEINCRKNGELICDENTVPIIGFGGSFTDSTCLMYSKMSSKNQELFKKAYFSKDGLGYNFCRIPIGSTDFSCRNEFNEPFIGKQCHGKNSQYTFQTDPEDAFELDVEDIKYRIPLIQKCKELVKDENGYDIRFLGSPWISPRWMMKDTKRPQGHLKPEYYSYWADYNMQFLTTYKEKADIHFFALTMQNEPMQVPHAIKKWQNLYFTQAETLDYVKNHLGPKLKEYNEKNNCNVHLICHDDSINSVHKSIALLKDNEYNQYIDGVAIHWYLNFLYNVPKKLKMINEALIQNPHPQKKQRYIINSESCEGFIKIFSEGPRLNNWTRGQNYANDILRNLNNYSSGYIDWNMVLNMDGQPNWVHNFTDAPILYDEEHDHLHFQPIYYFFGHFTKFIKPGSKKISFQSRGIAALQCTCYSVPGILKDKNVIVLVIMNRDMTGRKFNIKIGDQFINMSIGAKTIQTVLFKQ